MWTMQYADSRTGAKCLTLEKSVMKKSLVALAAMSVIGAVSAQSTVTLYGVADGFVGSKRANGATQTVVNSGGLSGSRWGLKVNEDLGGGLAAIAQFESGFSLDDGASAQGGALFGRQAFVGLKTAFGTVSLGRQKSAYYDTMTALSLQGNSSFDVVGSASHNDNPATDAKASMGAWRGYNARTNNSIKFQSAIYGGFSGAVVYGMGENKNKTGNTDISANDSYSLAATYANGPILVSLVHQEDAMGARAANNGRNVLRNTLVGGAYDLKVVKIGAGYNESQIRSGGVNAPKYKEYFVGVSAPLGATTLKAQYGRSKQSQNSANDSFGLEAAYSFSKRTDAYVGFNQTKIKNQGDLANTSLDSRTNRLYGIGMRHSF